MLSHYASLALHLRLLLGHGVHWCNSLPTHLLRGSPTGGCGRTWRSVVSVICSRGNAHSRSVSRFEESHRQPRRRTGGAGGLQSVGTLGVSQAERWTQSLTECKVWRTPLSHTERPLNWSQSPIFALLLCFRTLPLDARRIAYHAEHL